MIRSTIASGIFMTCSAMPSIRSVRRSSIDLTVSQEAYSSATLRPLAVRAVHGWSRRKCSGLSPCRLRLRLDGVEASPAQPRNSRLDRRRIIALLFAKDARSDKSIKRRGPVRNLDTQTLDAILATLPITPRALTGYCPLVGQMLETCRSLFHVR